jgi:isocitrate dehydrogenase (NAD+)
MVHRVTLIPGDGIGPEVTSAARRVLEAAGVEFEWDRQEAGFPAMEAHGTPLPQALLDSIRANKVALKGPVTTTLGAGFRSVNVAMRQELDLYASLRPIRAFTGVPIHYPGLDLVVVRENTEGLYRGIEYAVIPGEVAESIRVITRRGSERIVRFAFEYAQGNGRGKVTAVHKANILKLGDGLFLDAARKVAAEYPTIEYEERIVDVLCMFLVREPHDYDVLVLPNLYGDIVSDLCAGLMGGLGMAAGANFGDELAIFEPGHGSAPPFAGQNKLNPTATILSGALLLRHLGEDQAAERIETAVAAVIAEGRNVTIDLKRSPDDRSAVGTQEMADAIIAAL